VSETKIIDYDAEPTPALFHADESRRRGIMGPLGSGKSVACCAEILQRALQQAPNALGERKTRFVVVRNTYGELKTTTIKTFQEWIPESICPIVYDSPIRGNLTYNLPDGTVAKSEIYFASLDRPKDTRKVLSFEVTGAWINEAREIRKEIVDAIDSRLGRYPAKIDAPLTWTGMIMDTNPPPDDHWWHELAEIVQPEDWSFYRQPGAMLEHHKDGTVYYSFNPLAENVQHQPLGKKYWTDMISGKDYDWIKVHVCGEYGNLIDGKPVYPEFNSLSHISQEPLKPMRGLPLMLGWDFGNVACVFGQYSPKGQLIILDELMSNGTMGVRQFAETAVKPHIFQHYAGMKIQSFGDPSGAAKAQTDEKTCFQILGSVGIPTQPASTNNPRMRQEAVKKFLTTMRDDRPCLIIDPKCKVLIKGFMGSYQFRRIQVSGEAKYTLKPDKNKFSHIHDALQYASLGTGNFQVTVTNNVKQPKRKVVVSANNGGWA
jgi:hypothetical protein